MPANGGAARQVTQGDFDHGAPAWTSDSRRILFDGLRVPDAEYELGRHSEIYEVDAQSGNVRQLTKRRGVNAGPVPSPDGKRIAFIGRDWTDDTFFERELYVMEADGGGARQIAVGLDRTPANLTWAPDGSGVYFSAQDSGTSQLYFAPLSGAAKRLTEGSHMLEVTGIAGSRHGGRHRTSPRDLPHSSRSTCRIRGRCDVCSGRNEALLAGVRLGEVEEVRYRSIDGQKIQGWIVKPPDFDADEEVPADARDPRRPAQHVQRRVQLRVPGARGERLRRALHEPARQHRATAARSATRSRTRTRARTSTT